MAISGRDYPSRRVWFILGVSSIFDRSAGASLSQVITCPHCDQKLTLRDELKGLTLVCPQCKPLPTAPSPRQTADEPFGTSPQTSQPSGGSGMAFLEGFSAAAATTKAGRPKAGRSASVAARATASRAKKKNDSMMLVYIGGGVAATVLLVVLLASAMRMADSSGPKKDPNIRFGLPETKRRQLFKELILAVDQYGITKECKEEWLHLADEYKLDRKYVGDVLDEGFGGKDWSNQPGPRHQRDPRRAD